jgi:lipoprotein LprG
MRSMRWLAGTLVLLAAAGCAAGCTGGDGDSTPDGAQLVQRAAEATRQVETVRFDLTVDGQVQGIAISAAQGQLTKAGNVKGSAVVTMTGQPAESEFVIIGDTLYLKGATGGFQRFPLSVAATVYDPSTILDDNRGLAALVAGATEPSVQGREDVDGVETYRLKVTFASKDLGVLLPGAGAATDLPGELWIMTAEPNRPVRAKVDVPATSGTNGGTVTITLSQFNEPVTITPPG